MQGAGVLLPDQRAGVFLSRRVAGDIMAVFRDSNGDEYRVQLDAFLIADVRKQEGIDLADAGASGWETIEKDSGACVRVLSVVCGDEIRARKRSSRDFSKAMRGQAIVDGYAALVAEGSDFFPQSVWSAIRSNLAKRTEATKRAEELQAQRPILEMLRSLPEAMQAGAIQAMMEAAKAGSTSESQQQVNPSVSGLDVTPLSCATSTPESAELLPAA